MRLGIFARTFEGPTVEHVLDRVVEHNISLVHFNLKCAGLETLPDAIDDALCTRIRRAVRERRLEMVGISATYNMIHPDSPLRDEMTRRACRLIERARDLGTSLVTLCTGTRDPANMWRFHRDNDTPASWREMCVSLTKLLSCAEANGVCLGIEPEGANIVSTAAKTRRLLDEMQSGHLKIVLDGANLVKANGNDDMQRVFHEAFGLLKPEIALVHAKEIPGPLQPELQAAGAGRLDWRAYFRAMRSVGFDGPVVLHGLARRRSARASAFWKAK